MWIRKLIHPLSKVLGHVKLILLALIIIAEGVIWPPHSGAINGSLVSSPYCRISEVPLFSLDMFDAFPYREPNPCHSVRPLTKIVHHKSTGQPILIIDRGIKRRYITCPTECCYQQIRRMHGKVAEDVVAITECIYFEKAAVLSPEIESIFVKCNKANNGQLVYSNVHILIPERASIRKRLDQWKSKDTDAAVSVLIVGIDSVSRANFYRAMPKTADNLHKTGWFELTGYNKVGENTLPNLMTILAGYNINVQDTPRDARCNLHGFLDECPFIWKKFQQAGYVTAYAEDAPGMHTFTWASQGFMNPPTDYYLRPAILVAEKFLPLKIIDQSALCTGYQPQAKFIYDFSIDFASKHSNDSYFGLFWTNTFSHNHISTPMLMDEDMLQYFRQLNDQGILNKSVVFFVSDHGIRFGLFRLLEQGYFEERLPFFFVWLPTWLRIQHPEFVRALTINKNRLSTPHDIHMTLRHILGISGRARFLDPLSADCTKCQSIFKSIPYNRTCEDAMIPKFWCTCRYAEYKVNISVDALQKFVLTIEDYVRTLLKIRSISHLCEEFRVKSITQTRRIKFSMRETNKEYFIVEFIAAHDRYFDAMIQHDLESGQMSVEGASLLVQYGDNTCGRSDARKFCWCKNKS